MNLFPRSVLHSLIHCLGFFLASVSFPIHASEKPNIVFFFIDDLGWTDLGYMGSEYYETPHIDSLAQQSMVFTDAYANAPNCAPSRASLMTGKYTPRHGIYTVGDPRRGNNKVRKLEPIENETVLADDFVTVSEALQSNGYTTASMGKWHLGSDPRTQGFDVNVAGREWGSPSGGGYHSPYHYPELVNEEPGEYLTDRLTSEACQFIEDHKEGPFFLYLTHYAVHTPIQGKEELVTKYQQKTKTERHNNPKYAAMIESVDDSVGRVLDAVNECGLDENTIVVFFSDNGGFGGATSNAPLRGAKGMLYEGGIREPLLIKWPGVTSPNERCSEPVIGIDLYPTFLEMTDTPTLSGVELDGLSLCSLLRDHESTLDRPAIFWHFPCYLQGKGDPHGGPFRTTPAGAIRMGNWKLIEWFETGRLELYNLDSDLGEETDLSKSHPEDLKRLHSAMIQWREAVNAPIPTTPNPQYRANRN
ncbi:Arylsulfatase [Thalassoglobus neptunius]|uniref:Arylsulfatase n=1 Tax=Thalassoglobus neptunius TaxID=1938619 RepID=A0A5C5WII6_9PLAN|nr:sulfatase [Thalassoglobus neptunius]TWT49821.1 Arylsulfatase [Thalassoglobus neptunius]